MLATPPAGLVPDGRRDHRKDLEALCGKFRVRHGWGVVRQGGMRHPIVNRVPGWVVVVGSIAVVDFGAGVLLAASGVAYELAAAARDVLRERIRGRTVLSCLRDVQQGTTLVLDTGVHPAMLVRRDGSSGVVSAVVPPLSRRGTGG